MLAFWDMQQLLYCWRYTFTMALEDGPRKSTPAAAIAVLSFIISK